MGMANQGDKEEKLIEGRPLEIESSTRKVYNRNDLKTAGGVKNHEGGLVRDLGEVNAEID